MSQVVYNIDSPEAMSDLGRHLGSQLKRNLVLLLLGDLGAGKTHLSKAIGEGLGIKEIMTSPTFTILNTYRSGRLPLFHFDLYRIETESELEDIGFYEYVSQGVCLIEWAYKFKNEMPRRHILIEIEVLGLTERKVIISSDFYTEEELIALGGIPCI